MASHNSTVRNRGKRVHHCSDHFLVRFRLRDLGTHLCPMSCDVNVCSSCASHRRRTTLGSAEWKFDLTPDDDRRLRMHTFTWPREDSNCRVVANRLARVFTRLTKRVAWKKHVHGAFAGFETTGAWPEGEEGLEPGASGWLWHTHVVTSGYFWASHCRDEEQTDRPWRERDTLDPATCPCRRRKKFQPTGPKAVASRHHEGHGWGRMVQDQANRCIASLWFDLTGGRAYVVDSRQVYGDGAKSEAVKYVVKTLTLDGHGLREYSASMTRFQTSRWYGAWFGAKAPVVIPEVELTASVADLWAVAEGLLPNCKVPLRASHLDMLIAFKQLEHTENLEFEMVSTGWPRGPPTPHLVIGPELAARVLREVSTKVSRFERLTKGFYDAKPWKRWGWIEPSPTTHANIPF